LEADVYIALMAETEFTIFYAWQSDLPSEQNRTAILRALTDAAAAVEAQRGVVVIIDQATRDMLGADNVADTIRTKIEAADMFIGDVTTITLPPPDGMEARPCPNPNVTFEIGYAAAHLGWKRCTLLINTALAKHKDLPFDFAPQRVSAFQIANGKDSGGVKNLAKLLTSAITGVIDASPKRPAELRALDPALKRRERDLLAAEEALSQFSTTALQGHIQDLPRAFSQRDLDFFHKFASVATSLLFHINDPALNAAFRSLFAAWDRALSYPERYRNAGERLIFSNPGDAPLDADQEISWEAIEVARAEMAQALGDLLRIIREDYVEIDLVETNEKALARWQREQAEMTRMLEGKA